MGDEKPGKTDHYFGKLSSWLGTRISAFVAFLFLLFGTGAIFGAIIVPKFSHFGGYLLLAPIGLAVVAYYNRVIATVLFAGIVLFFVV